MSRHTTKALIGLGMLAAAYAFHDPQLFAGYHIFKAISILGGH